MSMPSSTCDLKRITRIKPKRGEATPPSAFMKIIIILLSLIIVLLGINLYQEKESNVEFYPPGQMGDRTAYYNSGANMMICDFCGCQTSLYKVDSKDRIHCPKCFRER